MKHFELLSVDVDSYSFVEGQPTINYQNTTSKDEVDGLKNQIELVKRNVWRNAVRFTNPYEDVTKLCGNKISRAYFKIREIMKDYDLEYDGIDDICTLHLCEGPGGFIHAMKDLRHKQKKQLDWTGITLKNEKNDPNVPDFVSDIEMENVTYGSDGTGDLTKVENVKYLEEYMSHKGFAHLVTADGGFDVSSDHCSQEDQSYKLLLCQAVAALQCQRLGGSFVMKAFDCYSNGMTELLYVLSIHYSQVFVTKPYSSRPCNSERYIVCKGFLGKTREEADALYYWMAGNASLVEQPSNAYIDRLQNINKICSEKQKNALRDTLAYAQRTQWIQRPKNMSQQFIRHYL